MIPVINERGDTALVTARRTKEHVAECQDRFPVVSENVQAHSSVQVNVRVVNKCVAHDNGSVVRVVFGDLADIVSTYIIHNEYCSV